MDRDAEHLRLLAIFHYVVAGLAAVFACIPLLHLAMGIFFVVAPQQTGAPAPVAFVGLLMAAMAAVMILAGWTFALLLAFAGRCLQQRRRHMFCIVMAGVACLFMPFGTVLGVFTIIVLSRPLVRAMFGKTEAVP